MKITEITNTTLPHLLLSPDDDSNIQHLIVLMGGNGERGDTFASLYKDGMPPNSILNNYDELLPNTQMVIGLIPRSLDWTQRGSTFNLLKETIDSNYGGLKPHFVGISLGAIAALKIPGWYPGYAASLGVLSGRGYVDKINEYTQQPLYIVHNSDDSVVKNSAISIIENIREQNLPDVESTILPYSGHDSWKWAFDVNNQENYYNWFKTNFIDVVDNPPVDEEPVDEEPVDTVVKKTVYVNGQNVGEFEEPITIKIE